MRDLTVDYLPHIEKALGIRLYDNQKGFLLYGSSLGWQRCTGKTTAYCVKLALSEGEPLNLKKPELFSDECGLADHRTYSRRWFRYTFMEIRGKLKDYGFPVREVKR